MSMETRTLELFARVATLGAFGKAGREFGLSPTAATQRIKGLEAELGVTLFNRTTRSVALTTDGEVFLAYTKRILVNIEDARSELAGDNTAVKGQLRVTGSASFGRRYIAPYITEFLSSHPEISVRLHLSDGVIDIVDQGFDLALRIGTLPSSSLVARKLADNPRLLVASPTYLKKTGIPEKPTDLASHNCIILGENRNWKLSDNNGEIHDIRVSGNFTTNYGDVATEAALTDAGIALKSIWDIRHELSTGSLVPLLEDYTIFPLWKLWAVRPPGQLAPARVRAFMEFIETKFRQLPS